MLELGNGSAAELGEGILLSGSYVQFYITIDGDSSSITLKNGTVLTSRTSPGINWNGYPSRFSFGIFTDPPVQVTDTGAVVVIDFDLGRSFYAIDPANAAAGFGYVGYMQVRNTAMTGSVSGTVVGANAGPIPDASIALTVASGSRSVTQSPSSRDTPSGLSRSRNTTCKRGGCFLSYERANGARDPSANTAS